MTCVVGLVAEDSKVWIGSDSATTWDSDHARIQVARNAKVFRVGSLLIGSSGSGRIQNLLRGVTVPKRTGGVSSFNYVAIHVADAIRKTLQASGALIPGQAGKEGHAEMMPSDSTILIGYKGGLYRMDSDFSVDESADEIEAIGSGATWALPVLELTAGKPPKERIIAALKRSEKNCWSVRRPWRIEVL